MEIHKALETFSSEFKTKVEDYFRSSDVVVELKNLNFSIEAKNTDEYKLLNNKNVHSTLKCHFNSQGQVVCK